MPFVEDHQEKRGRAWAHAIDVLRANDADEKVLEIVIHEATWYVPLRDKQPSFRDLKNWSQGARDARGVGLKREHVTTRSGAKLAMAQGDRRAVEDVLGKMIVCVVTDEEHEHLRPFRYLDGWDRYKAAGVRVYDIREQHWLW